jgi:hypothetical protein
VIEPFDPRHLTPSASLNRVRIMDLPGLNLPDMVKGKTGYDLVSAKALCELIRQYADGLQLTETDLAADERHLPIIFDGCFESADAAVRTTADAIRSQIKQHLAYLLLTLHRGDAVNRAVRTDWDDSYWNHWAGIQQVVIGGGLFSGHLGQIIGADFWAAFPARMTASVPGVTRNPYGNASPLVGAARYAPAGEAALTFDFGGSFVKRGLALYRDGILTEMRMLPTLPTRSTTGQAEALFAFMVRVIGDTWKQIERFGVTPVTTIPVSIASYVRNGQPLERQGGAYAELRLLHTSTQQALSEALREQIGLPITIHLLHDGTAAASIYAGLESTAVVTVGTAIGNGFPPSQTELRPAADRVKIGDWQA